MSPTNTPPRFVPTLTDVVQPAAGPRVDTLQAPAAQGFDNLDDQIVHRVMQRVDLVLERRLREAVAHVILAHTQTLAPRLREEIDLVVRESVSQAVAQELSVQRSSS